MAVVAGLGACTGDAGTTFTGAMMPWSQVQAAAERASSVAESVTVGLNRPDSGLFLAQFADGAVVVDPVDAVDTPDVASWFSGERGLCETWGLVDVFVNADGSLTDAYCEGFFAPTAGGPDRLDAARHLLMTDGLATRMMHRFDVDHYGSYPDEILAVIGYPSDRAGAVLEQVDAARGFAESLTDAWTSADPVRIAALYAADGFRDDPFAGLAPNHDATVAWFADLTGAYDSIALSLDTLDASALGPAATYELRLVDGTTECSMRLASVWNLDDEGRVTREWLYYDPDTLNACGWWDDGA
ncbi:hypothetical protein OEB99_17135 [Actinotalea sp. M2MS4P-6]|uniref:hypothetical protein n=1 Tax=Actinotalea sp. M2MS4P-6 TaxID=2983762 RepID=UPI0021E38453|nr:hypothetical protein [Actinotalea sp. M2MS4P-6]MCV2396039.1 hypothetical protein [Actinotalea sp. M2MS4P-6]